MDGVDYSQVARPTIIETRKRVIKPTPSLQILAIAELWLLFAPSCGRESIVFIVFR